MLEAIIRRGTLLTVGVLVVCVLGVIATLRVPIQMIPDLEVRVISVRTYWPGATPQDVEKEIVIEQEDYLRNIPGLKRLTSQASTGQAVIQLEFPFGTDVNEALIRVNNALSQVSSYPENVDEPRIYTSSFSDHSFMYFRITPLPGNPKGLDMKFMADFISENVQKRLERVPGVSEISIRGGAERQIQIFVDPAKLAERGITIPELRDIIRARNVDVSGGDMESGKRRYLIRTLGRFRNLDELGQLIIKHDGDSITRLNDVADIRLDHYKMMSDSFVNGQPVLFLSVRREIGSNVIAIKRAIIPEAKQISKEILEPAGMKMELTTDDVRYVESSIRNVWQNLLLGGMLATLVMFVFLRSARATLIGILGIPICTIAAFLGLLVAGRTINVISLAGVAFAIGMTVDNTIVVLESIEHERRKGLGRFDSVIVGVKKVWTAVLASTLTTVLVFMPVFFVQEEAGQLYSDIAVAICASIILSMVVAVTVVPTASNYLNFGRGRDSRFGRWLKSLITGLVNWLVTSNLRSILCVIGIMLATFAIIDRLTPPAEYLPEGEEHKTFSTMIAPAGYSLTEMTNIARELNSIFTPHLHEDPKLFAEGKSKIPGLNYLIIWTQPQQLRMVAETTDPKQINDLMDIVDDIFRSYPGMRVFSARGSIISSNNGGTRSVNVDISGTNLKDIFDTATTVYDYANKVFGKPRINSTPSSLILGQPLVEITPDWERASELGISTHDIGYTVAAMTDGAYVGEFFLNDDRIDMYLYNSRGNIHSLNKIKDIPYYTENGTVVPLGAVTKLKEVVDTDTIYRLNGRRTVTLNIIAPRSVPLEIAVQKVRNNILKVMKNRGEIPRGVSMDISGASDQLDATRASLTGNFYIAIVLCYLLLVAIFTNWAYPLIIMTTVPLGIAGGIGGLWLLNAIGAQLPLLGIAAISQPFDMITMLGFLILVGTVVNNPILIVDKALTNMREHQMTPVNAVTEAVDSRIRPIMMSMITTVCGLAPLVLIPGAGTELYRGLGAIVMFGLFFATLITLIFLPALLVTVFRIRDLFVRK